MLISQHAYLYRFCSTPSGISSSAPESEWINNTKVWLDVWDPDSGFHFPDRQPERCPFLLPSDFFQETWNNRTEDQTPKHTQTQTKETSSVENGYWGATAAGPRCPDVPRWMVKLGIMSLSLDTLQACVSKAWKWSHMLSLSRRYSVNSPVKLMRSLTPCTKHLDQALILRGLSRKWDTHWINKTQNHFDKNIVTVQLWSQRAVNLI